MARCNNGSNSNLTLLSDTTRGFIVYGFFAEQNRSTQPCQNRDLKEKKNSSLEGGGVCGGGHQKHQPIVHVKFVDPVKRPSVFKGHINVCF